MGGSSSKGGSPGKGGSPDKNDGPGKSGENQNVDSEKKNDKTYGQAAKEYVQKRYRLHDRIDPEGNVDNTPTITKGQQLRNEQAQLNTGEHMSNADSQISEKVGEDLNTLGAKMALEQLGILNESGKFLLTVSGMAKGGPK